MAFYEYLIPIVVVGGLLIIVICKATNQTLPELLEGLRDFIWGVPDEAKEITMGNY